MPLFPLFIDLNGKKCVVIGGGTVAARKVETLLQFGARLTVVSPEATPGIAEREKEGRVAHVKREYVHGDLEGAFLAIAASSDSSVNAEVYVEASERGIPVNVADDPAKCSFVFPSTVVRGEFSIGIATSGLYPALSRRVREIIDDNIPQDMGKLLELLAGFRSLAALKIKDSQKRAGFLEKIMDEGLKSSGKVGIDELRHKFENMLEEYRK